MSDKKSLALASDKKELSPTKRAEKVGRVVAVQLNYDVIEYDTTPADIEKLKEQYKGLKGDTTEGYQAVKDAISDCTARRTTVEKMRKVYKQPGLDWGKEVDARAKQITEKLTAIEKPLKTEKDRIDAIKAEEKRAREEARLRTMKAQQDNLNKVRLIATNLYGLDLNQLNQEMEALDCFDLEAVDLGDYLEDAKVEMANARIRVEHAIAQEKQRLEIEDEKERLRKQREDDLKAQHRRDYYESMIRHIECCGMGFIGDQPQPYGLLHSELTRKIQIDDSWGEYRERAEAARDTALARLEGIKAKQAEEAQRLEQGQKAEQELAKTKAKLAEADAEKRRKQDAEQVLACESNPEQETETDSKPAAETAGFHDLENAQDKEKLGKFITQLSAVSFGAPVLKNEHAQAALDQVVTALDKGVAFLSDAKSKFYS